MRHRLGRDPEPLRQTRVEVDRRTHGTEPGGFGVEQRADPVQQVLPRHPRELPQRLVAEQRLEQLLPGDAGAGARPRSRLRSG